MKKFLIAVMLLVLPMTAMAQTKLVEVTEMYIIEMIRINTKISSDTAWRGNIACIYGHKYFIDDSFKIIAPVMVNNPNNTAMIGVKCEEGK